MSREYVTYMDDVLEGMYGILSAIIPTVYVTSRPSAAGDKSKEYAVIRMSNGERDRGDTYNTARLLISLYVRDKEGEIENNGRLRELKDKIFSLCPITMPRFSADRPNIIGAGADTGFHYRVIQLSITINKKTLKHP